MRAVLSCGGTAGHIYPAIAIADEIMKSESPSEILFIGRKDGMEQQLVAERGYRIAGVEVHGLMRGFSAKNILFNLRSVAGILPAEREARRILTDFSPDVVIGCGGYVSGPVLRRAAKMGIPTAIQEQNAFPGLTTRLLAKHVGLIFAANEDGAKRIGYPEKTVVSGNPVREAFFSADRAAAREKWNAGGRVFVLTCGGSNGARKMNEIAAAFVAKHRLSDGVFHLHVTGKYAKDSFWEYLAARGIDAADNPNLRVIGYADDMPEICAAADLIVSRAGALTISELAAAGRASVLIPSANVTENHQYYNALSLSDCGAAFVYEEKDLDVDRLADRLMELAKTPDYLKTMGENARRRAVYGSAGVICRKITEMLSSRRP